MKYTKKAGQFVCKMAMPLALMFAACSTEGDHVNAQVGDTPTLPRGGAEEETSVVASLENVTVGGRAKRMSPLGGSEDLGKWNGAAGEGSVIRMAELDSVTLDTTGVFYYTECFSSSGDFSFDSVSLNSPYVMFELAPYVEDAELNRVHFRGLRNLAVDIGRKNIDNIMVNELSMGMTGDFEVAIEEGATLVRVGTGIFGERNYNL